MQKFSIIVAFFCVVAVFSCTRDETESEPPPCDSAFGYTLDIQPIFETSCTYSTCHDGSGATDYRTFDKVSTIVNNGQLSNRVLTAKNMPPLSATPLSDNQLEIIRMWVLAGAPEERTEVEVTYDNGIGDLLVKYCASAGCHDAEPGGEQAPRNYNFYSEISVHINNGSFLERVITDKDNAQFGMPPERAVDQFTPEEFNLIKCWIEKGYPEN